MNKIIYQFLLAFIAITFTHCSSAKLLVEITEPSRPDWNRVTGVIVAGFDNDLEPNPCYQIDRCTLKAFVNSASWGDEGRDGYGSVDSPPDEWNLAAVEEKTLGDFVKRVRALGLLNRTMTDYLPESMGVDPVFCVYAARLGVFQIKNTLVSNCARSIPAPSQCSVKNQTLDYDFGKVTQDAVNGLRKSQVFEINCSRSTNIKIKVGEVGVVLNGYSNKKVNFSFDDAVFDNEWHGEVVGTKSIVLTAELPQLEIGTWSGASILMITPD